MAITQKLKEIYASAPTTQRFIETLSFEHSRFDKTYYMTNDNQEWRFLLESGDPVTFTVMPFRVVLPTLDGRGNQDLNLTLANIGRDLVDPIESAIVTPSEPIVCTYRVYLDTKLTKPQNSPPLALSITGIEINRDTVSASATRADVLNRAFPYNMYMVSEFPGLRR